MNKQNDGFTFIELLIVMALLGMLFIVFALNLFRVRGRVDDAASKAYLREVRVGIEIQRSGNNYLLPPAQSCASLTDKDADPESVISCTYQPGKRDAYSVIVVSRTGSTFSYDGTDVEDLP